MRRYGRNGGDVYEMRKAGDSISWRRETKLRGWKSAGQTLGAAGSCVGGRGGGREQSMSE